MTLTLTPVLPNRTKRSMRGVPPVTPELLEDVRRKAERALHCGHTVNLTAHVAFALLRALGAGMSAPDASRQPRLF